MNCADFRRAAPEVLYHLTTPARRAEAEAHAAACPSCRAAFASLHERLCSEIHDALDDCLDRTMRQDERETFDAHLAVCPECRDYLSSYAATVRLGKAAHASPAHGPPPPPKDLVAAVLAARKR